MLERDVFFINKCRCNVYICKQCYRSVRNHATNGLYKCVMCRKAITDDYMSTEPIIIDTRTLSNSERNLAKKNWRSCFKLFGGYNIILKYNPNAQLTYNFIHGQMLTPSFKYINQAGVCLNMSEARQYVNRQLIAYKERKYNPFKIYVDNFCHLYNYVPP